MSNTLQTAFKTDNRQRRGKVMCYCLYYLSSDLLENQMRESLTYHSITTAVLLRFIIIYDEMMKCSCCSFIHFTKMNVLNVKNPHYVTL